VTALVPATLQRLTVVVAAGKDSDAKVRTDGEPLEVQFNPVSMRLTRNNNVDRGGVTTQTQKRRHPSQEAAKLSFDLEFDTAERHGKELLRRCTMHPRRTQSNRRNDRTPR
jgi:hypothetical protein